MQKRHRCSLGEKLSDAAELTKDITLGLPKITLLAQKEAYIENYRGIIEYDPQIVRLGYTDGIITLYGKDLTIASITDEDITINGIVTQIVLSASEV